MGNRFAGKRWNNEKVGEFMMEFVEIPNMREICRVADPTSAKKYVQDTTISMHLHLI